MRNNKYARRVDENQPAIVKELEKNGYTVIPTFRVGGGFPDLLVISRTGIPVLLEIKMPGENLNKNEKAFFQLYKGPIFMIHSATLALAFMAEFDRQQLCPLTL